MEKDKNIEIIKQLCHDPALRDRYQLISVIGEGCFGKIIKVRNKKDDRMAAIKLESTKKNKFKSILKNQISILKRLQGKSGIPKLYSYGMWSDGFFLQMQLLEHDLNKSIKQYSISEITDLTLQLLKILNEIHNENIIHQDLKPHNLMKSKSNKLFIIDFGLGKSISAFHNCNSLKGFIGTPRYASIRAHNMLEQNKKDDLQSLFYNIAYLYYRKLPWSRLSVSNQEKMEKIKLLKIRHKQTLFNQMPFQFQKAFDYINGLNSYEEPDYNYLRGFFKRNKTVLEITSKQPHSQRSKVKRLSLNYTNFLQVPDVIFERKGALQGNSEQKKSLNMNASQNMNSLGIASDVILSHFLQFQQWNTQNYQSQSEQGALPDISKYFKNMILKNPFG